VLESRQRFQSEPGALHLTRRQDLLDLEMPEPNLSLYGPSDDEVWTGEAAQKPVDQHTGG